MPETLLSLSEVLLFGRVVEDIRVPSQIEGFMANAASTGVINPLKGLGPVDGVPLLAGEIVLVRMQANETNNGLYIVGADAANTWAQAKLGKGAVVAVTNGDTLGGTSWEQKMPRASGKQRFQELTVHKPGRRGGKNKQLEEQLLDDDARFARIYGFAYEGTYYELPNPTLFLVHGEGESATAGNAPIGSAHASRAPTDPSVSGVASADFQFADDILCWAYDKADYTIRMDAETGMFEQVLLDLYFGFDSPAISGAKVSGAKVSGAKARGPGD